MLVVMKRDHSVVRHGVRREASTTVNWLKARRLLCNLFPEVLRSIALELKVVVFHF